MNTRSSRRSLILTGLALATVIPLSACAGGSAPSETADAGGGPTGTDPDTFTVLTANENPTLEAQLTALSEDQCKAENKALPLEHQKTAQADVVQKVTLLASQDALPAHFIAGTAMVRPDGDLGKAGLVLRLREAARPTRAPGTTCSPPRPRPSTTSTARWSRCRTSTTSKASGTTRRSSKSSSIEEPQTFDELLDASDTIADGRLRAVAMAGAAGWPLTRIMGMYIFRNVGPDAMADIRDGKAKLTDPDYVDGAEALAGHGEERLLR